MEKIKIGIQGGKGSTNERACIYFAKKYNWDNYEIRYLISTENVLRELHNQTIDYGTFAWESSRGGFVKETQKAIQKYTYEKIDEYNVQIDHALLINGGIDISKKVTIVSHPQAIKEHKVFLEKEFPMVELLEEVDTAIAAEKLSTHTYPKNTLVIAPIACAKMYNLKIYLADLPTNKGYFTKIYLVKSG